MNQNNNNFSSSGMKKLKHELFRKSLNRTANSKGCSCRNSNKNSNKGKK